ncbi:MAG: YihY/virulence factor BrkB family protein [Deltaproteobacteria bacterium]|nr:YihY/virulence factor BrkB family protein [Deltaproteobacteria bacterium]
MKRVAGFFGGVIAGFRTFFRNDCVNRAAAISFYAIFSIMQLMLLLTAGLGFVLGKNTGMLDKVIDFVRQTLPYLSDKLISDLKGISRIWKTLGWVSIISLFWSAQFVLDGVANALVAVFDTGKKFGFFRKKIINILVLIAALAAVLASVMIAALAGILRRVNLSGSFGINVHSYQFEGALVKVFLPGVVIALAVTFAYRIFAGPNLNLRYAFYGSVVFTLLWEAAKYLFAVYIANFPTYNTFYASMGALMIFMIWIYFSVSIFLYSAAFAKAAYERRGG